MASMGIAWLVPLMVPPAVPLVRNEPPPAQPQLPTIHAPTFHELVEPLLQRHCQECHRSGGCGPFALERYDEVAGWAPQIKEVVATRRMPPWYADPTVGKFANDRSLPKEAIDTIAAWVDGGAKEGDAATAPPKRTWPVGWSLAEPPDLVLTTAPFAVASEGTLPYEYVRLPTHLTEERWVRAAELRSTEAQLVHHVLVFLDEPRSPRNPRPAVSADAANAVATTRPWRPAFNPLELMQGAKPNEIPKWSLRFQKMIQRDLRYGEAGGLNGYFFSGLAGGGAVVFGPDEGKFLPAGSDLIFQIHYQPTGKPGSSSTSIALWFAATPSKRALDTRGVSTVVFTIPPGAPAHEVTAEYRLPAAASLRSLQPHMHLRGKDFTYVAKYPDGREETLLIVPHYDFDWQQEYLFTEPKHLPADTVLRVIAHYDNSPANSANPDPNDTVYFGLQTYEGMLIGYFEVVWLPEE